MSRAKYLLKEFEQINPEDLENDDDILTNPDKVVDDPESVKAVSTFDHYKKKEDDDDEDADAEYSDGFDEPNESLTESKQEFYGKMGFGGSGVGDGNGPVPTKPKPKPELDESKQEFYGNMGFE